MSDDSKIPLFKWKEFRLPSVKRLKLGKTRKWGRYGDRVIEVDECLKGVRELEIYVHEFYHWDNPEWNEDEVRLHSRKLTDFLWREGYRKVDNNLK